MIKAPTTVLVGLVSLQVVTEWKWANTDCQTRVRNVRSTAELCGRSEL